MEPLALISCGMATGVGLGAAATCAALRCGIAGFAQTRFRVDGNWLRGSAVPLPDGLPGRGRLLQMAFLALKDCIADMPEKLDPRSPLLLCLSETSRPQPGGMNDAELLAELRSSVGLLPDAAAPSQILRAGRLGAAHAMLHARRLLALGHRVVIVLGVDSLLNADCIAHYGEKGRLLSESTLDGFIPGEAAAAVALTALAAAPGPNTLFCIGCGFAEEEASIGAGRPLRGSGLVQAITAALADAGCTFAAIDYRLTDVNGEHYAFKEASVALLRIMRAVKPELELWHPADCVGEVGAAAGPLILGAAMYAAKKDYAPGPTVLCHFASDAGARAALILRHQKALHV